MQFLVSGNSKPEPHPYLQLSPAALLTTINGTLYKLVAGTTGFDLRTSPTYPNCTYSIVFQNIPLNCTTSPSNLCCPRDDMRPKNPAPIGPAPLEYQCGQGCLFDIEKDETELNDLCEVKQDICYQAMRQLVRINQTNYEPFHGCHLYLDTCNVFHNQWNDTYGPFINVDNCETCIHTTKQYFDSSTAVKKTSNECQCQTSNSTCESTECTWTWTSSTVGYCDYKPMYKLLTYPEVMALRRFQNYTKGKGRQ